MHGSMCNVLILILVLVLHGGGVDGASTWCLNTPLSSGMMCVGTAREADVVAPCLGVPGAPLVINGKLAGILSWGFGCGYLHDLPLVYTSIQGYAPWLLYNIPIIRNITKKDLDDLFIATRSYKLMRMLNRTRIVKNQVHKHLNKEVVSINLDDHLVRLAGDLYDVRDFVYDSLHHERKKNIYEYLKSVFRATSVSPVRILPLKNGR